MRKVIIDTDLFSECLKGKDEAVGTRYSAYVRVHRRLTITSWTAFEILAGIHHRLPQKLETYERILAECEEIIPAASDYRLAAQIEGALLRLGTPIGNVDPMIAA